MQCAFCLSLHQGGYNCFLLFYSLFFSYANNKYRSIACFSLALCVWASFTLFWSINTQTLQFALHYSWSTEARARRALANISALLRPGGTFIGTMPDANVIIKKLRAGSGFLPFKYFSLYVLTNTLKRHIYESYVRNVACYLGCTSNKIENEI